jgi:GNAT superfamily N-acetyltransferase
MLKCLFGAMPSVSEHEQLTIRPMAASDVPVYFGAMQSVSEHERLTIRPMAAGDAAVVAEMARELAAALDDPEPVLKPGDLVRDGMGSERWFDCLVAIVDSNAIGYAMVCRGYEAHIGKRRLWLSDLYVRAHARRTGAGRALMRAVARLATAHGCEAVYWDLWRLNRVGKAFYESLGAVEDGDLAIWRVASSRLATAGGKED